MIQQTISYRRLLLYVFVFLAVGVLYSWTWITDTWYSTHYIDAIGAPEPPTMFEKIMVIIFSAFFGGLLSYLQGVIVLFITHGVNKYVFHNNEKVVFDMTDTTVFPSLITTWALIFALYSYRFGGVSLLYVILGGNY